MLTSILKAVVTFLPNIVKSYTEKKPLEKSSELYVAIAAVVGQLLATYKIVPQEQWDVWGASAIVYVLGRILSKGADQPVA